MAVELTMQVEVTVTIEHDGPTEGFKGVWLQTALEGGLRTATEDSPYSVTRLKEKLAQAIRCDETDLGWVDDNTRFMLTELVSAEVVKIEKIKAGGEAG